ncbi:MAG: transposase [Candidatus Parabeggiatoa sp.]|nr:transposase [Candidatus Parabeggiatoa sp.]
MRALKTKMRGLNKTQFKRLRELTAHAKNLYNQSLWILREAFDATGKYFSYPQMDRAMKQVANREGEINYKLLKAKVAQQTLRRVDQNFKSFFQASKDFKKNQSKYKGQPRPPRFKQKRYDNLIFDYQAFKVKGTLVLLEKGLEIKLPPSLVGKTIKQIEIIPKHHLFQAVFVYEEEVQNFKLIEPNDQIMSIDLGLNNLATCVTNGMIKPFIIDGRRIKSLNAYYNKRKAKIQSELEKSRGIKWSHKLQSLTDKRNARVNDYLHKATAYVIKTCLTHNISKVVIGDVAKSLDHINLGKKTNQNFVNLSLGQFVDKLSYKLGQHGIKLIVANESYTSKASFLDGDKMPKKYDKEAKPIYSGKRIKRGLYRSKDGTLINADVNGAYNILRKGDSKFSFSSFLKRVGNNVKEWLHPTERIFIS